MSNASSQNDLFQMSEELLEAADRSPDVLSDVQSERRILEEALVEAKSLKARQQELTAQRQETTQKLKEALGRLREAWMLFRALARAKLGLRNERLVQFQVAPLRARSRGTVSTLKKEVGKPVNGEPAETESPSAKPVA